MGIPYLFLNVMLFVITVGWVGKRPTLRKVGTMICIVTIVQAVSDTAVALSQGMSIYEWYLDALHTSANAYSEVFSSDQMETFNAMAPVVAGCWLGTYFVQSSALVGIALVIAWFFKRIRKRAGQWAPFSSIDLPMWVVGLVIAGIALIAVSNLPFVPQGSLVRLVAYNVLIISAVPVVVQGLAALKGVMNRLRMPGALQLIIVLVLAFFGALAVILPIMGLIDFWANFRRLPRDSEAENAD